jgi:hypothetical protein
VKHISETQDIGKGRRCLIVGGGLSIESFPWHDLPSDIDIICCNNHMVSMANVVVYYDKEMKAYYESHDLADDTILIGFKNGKVDHTVRRCDYYYVYDDVYHVNPDGTGSIGDTGFHTVRFADEIWQYQEIYIIGLDYWVLQERYHGNSRQDDSTLISRFKTHSIGKVLPKYGHVKWKNKIYNCSESSKLKQFPYKLPT